MNRCGLLLVLSLLGAPVAVEAQTGGLLVDYPTRVPLESGDTLVLGQRIPDRLLAAAERLPHDGYLIRLRPTGLFVGATHAQVAHREGQVRYIELFFAPPVELDALYARLVEAIGPPPEGRSPDPEMPVYWTGRDHAMIGLESYTLESGVTVTALSLFRGSP